MEFMNAIKGTLNNEYNVSVTENGAVGYRTSGKELLINNLIYSLSGFGVVEQTPQIVKATVLGNEVDYGDNHFGVGVDKICENDSKQSSFAQALSNITSVEEPLHCENIILTESLLETLHDILFGHTTKRSNGEVQIEQLTPGLE